jgi:hypothetical protein
LELEKRPAAQRRSSLKMARTIHVYTISRVARELDEDQEWLAEIAFELEPEDGRVYIWSDGEDSEIGLTDFGIENLQDLIREYRGQGRAPPPKP